MTRLRSAAEIRSDDYYANPPEPGPEHIAFATRSAAQREADTMTCKHGNIATRPCAGCAAEVRAIRDHDERDRAVIARIGGNEYRRAFQPPGEGWAWKAGPRLDGYVRDNAESLHAGRSYLRGAYSQPYRGSTPEWDTRAVFHGLTHVMSPRPDSRAMLPESAFSWPIYRAAMAAAYRED